MVWLDDGESTTSVVMFAASVVVSANGNMEGMLRQVVGDVVSMKVTAAKVRVEREKCILLEMTLTRDAR